MQHGYVCVLSIDKGRIGVKPTEMVMLKCDICKKHVRLLHPIRMARTITRNGVTTTERELQYVCRECYDRFENRQ
ncbi:MAG: hypothetical protein ACFE7E_07295 [Candidatus Hodarchaeota archaeon]